MIKTSNVEHLYCCFRLVTATDNLSRNVGEVSLTLFVSFSPIYLQITVLPFFFVFVLFLFKLVFACLPVKYTFTLFL